MRTANPIRHALATFCLVAALSLLAGCVSTPGRESTGEYVDDALLTARVKAALVADPGVRATEVNVESFKGRVQLSGFVSSEAAIERAVTITRSLPGVASVANDMRLK